MDVELSRQRVALPCFVWGMNGSLWPVFFWSREAKTSRKPVKEPEGKRMTLKISVNVGGIPSSYYILNIFRILSSWIPCKMLKQTFSIQLKAWFWHTLARQIWTERIPGVFLNKVLVHQSAGGRWFLLLKSVVVKTQTTSTSGPVLHVYIGRFCWGCFCWGRIQGPKSLLGVSGCFFKTRVSGWCSSSRSRNPGKSWEFGHLTGVGVVAATMATWNTPKCDPQFTRVKFQEKIFCDGHSGGFPCFPKWP